MSCHSLNKLNLSVAADGGANGLQNLSVQSYFCGHFLLFNNLQQGLDPTSVFKNTLHRFFACLWHVGDVGPPSEQHWPVVQTQLEFHPFRGSMWDKNQRNKRNRCSPACVAALTELMKLFKCETILHCPSRFLWYCERTFCSKPLMSFLLWQRMWNTGLGWKPCGKYRRRIICAHFTEWQVAHCQPWMCEQKHNYNFLTSPASI